MINRIAVILLILFSLTRSSFGQFVLSGQVVDKGTQVGIADTYIYFSGSNVVLNTDSSGFFQIALKKNTYQLSIKHLNYKLFTEKINLENDLKIKVELIKKDQLLDEISVTAERPEQNIQKTVMGVEKLSGKTLKRLPNLMGETDVIRSILLLPGVSTVGEGASGFNVRGGNVDQNLILLDGVPLFNTSHLFGFFTGFNSDLVQDLSLYKSGIPSRFGGRSSSVLNVRLKEGNFEKFSVQGGIGPLSSKLIIDSPLKKDKTSILIGLRGSLSDFYLRFFDNPNLSNSKANFYDANIKITHKINAKQKLSLSAYKSSDSFKFAQDTSFNNNSQYLSLKHDWLISSKLSNTLTSSLSSYFYGINGLKDDYEFSWAPSIDQKIIKDDITFQFNNNSSLNVGLEYITSINDAGSLQPTNINSIIKNYSMPIQHSREMAAFVGHSFKLNNKLGIDYGLRYSKFNLVGPETSYTYATNVPRELSTIIDTVSYSKNQNIASYGGFEPRLSISYVINENLSLKAGYTRMQQYVHLISNTMAVSPSDIWKNSNENIPQEITDQFSVGVFKNFINSQNNVFESSVEVYYKKLANVVDYLDGANLYLNNTVDTDLLVGNGRAYGVEFFLRKPKGKVLTGWLSYTYARSFRKVEEYENQVGANFGLEFPTNYDSPHNFKFVVNNRWTKRLTFNANFTYTTGRPITYPNGRYKLYAFNDVHNYLIENNLIPRQGYITSTVTYGGQVFYRLESGTINEIIDGYSVPSFSLRNQERIPDYIRLDIGFNIDPKVGSKSNSSWNFSIYNILSRQNVYSVYFKSQTGLRNQARTYKLSVLGAAIPSLTYNFKF